MKYMDVMDRLSEIIDFSKTRDHNEADTRHKIIDSIIHDCLSWPKNRVSVEEYINPGYADYVLKKSTGEPLLFIEAKKSGIYFELPLPKNPDIFSEYIVGRRRYDPDSTRLDPVRLDSA